MLTIGATSSSPGSGPNPSYVEAYGQLDGSASYEFLKGFTVFVEGINLTGASRRGHMRHVNNVTFVSPGFARYSAGVRISLGGGGRSAATAAAATATAAAAATAGDADLPGRFGDPGDRRLSGSAAATSAATAGSRTRRLRFN